MIKIYKATNTLNGKSYIGQTKSSLNKRISEHTQDAKHGRDHCRRFCDALRKYGFENFKWTVICECESQEEANKQEMLYIQALPIRERYNIMEEIHGVYKRTDKTREKSSRTQKQRWLEGKNKGNSGHTATLETRKKIGVRSAEKFKDKKYLERETLRLSKFWGRKHSEETKQKMSVKADCRKRDSRGRFLSKENQ